MDRTAVEELFHFTDFSWGTYQDLIRPLGDEVLTRPAPGSGWPALRDALSHMSWAWIRWLQNPDRTTDETVQLATSWDQVEAYRRRVREHARRYLDSLSESELLTPRAMDVDGETLVFSPADIFAHVFLHERQHHGDLNTLLYQLGIEVPMVEYRFSLPQRALR